MPHIIVKLWPGKSQQQNARLADAITKDVMAAQRYGEESVSVAFEDLTLPIDRVADGYRAMDERRAIKTLLRP